MNRRTVAVTRVGPPAWADVNGLYSGSNHYPRVVTLPAIVPWERTMNTINTQRPKVPRMNFKAIREALKAHGITFVDITYEVEFRCEVCGMTDFVDGSLRLRLRKSWWRCQACHPEVGDGEPHHPSPA